MDEEHSKEKDAEGCSFDTPVTDYNATGENEAAPLHRFGMTGHHSSKVDRRGAHCTAGSSPYAAQRLRLRGRVA
jgi:hypothetical protein